MSMNLVDACRNVVIGLIVLGIVWKLVYAILEFITEHGALILLSIVALVLLCAAYIVGESVMECV